jgi:hypothetical protein
MNIFIDYKNTGFGEVKFEKNLLPLAKLCKKKQITDVKELYGGFLNRVFKIKFETGCSVLKVSPLWSKNVTPTINT